MLERQHGRGREEGDLLAVHDRLERRAHRDLGLAVADVAAEQAIHRRGRLHVLLDVDDGAGLIGRQLVRECVLELLLPMGVGRERVSRDGLALRIQLQQLLGHVAHGLLDAGLRLLPGRAAEAVERGPRAAGVLLDEIQPLDGNEELVLACVAKLEKLLRRLAGAPNAELLQTDELADAMVDVDDEIAHLEVAKVREKRLGEALPLVGRTTLLFEDIGLGIDLKRRLREPEPAGERADGHQHRCGMRILDALDEHGDDVVLPQDFHGPLGAAVAVGDKENRVAPLARRADLGDPVVDPAAELHRGLAGHLADLAWASVRRASPAPRAAARHSRGPRCPPTPRMPRRWKRDDVSAARGILIARVELVAHLPGLLLDLLVLRDDHAGTARRAQKVNDRQRRVALVEPLPDGHNQELIRGTGRPLRGGVEPPQRFDHVADELDARRLDVAGGKDVDNAAANGEGAVLFYRILSREAGVDEEVGQIERLDFRARPDRERRAQQARRGAHPRKKRRRGRDDEPGRAAGGGMQRASPRGGDAEVRVHAAIGIDLD